MANLTASEVPEIGPSCEVSGNKSLLGNGMSEVA